MVEIESDRGHVITICFALTVFIDLAEQPIEKLLMISRLFAENFSQPLAAELLSLRVFCLKQSIRTEKHPIDRLKLKLA